MTNMSVGRPPLQWLMYYWMPGDEWTWEQEFEYLRTNHTGKLDMLTTSIQETGVQVPVQLGRDFRVWDGHHRIFASVILGLTDIPAQIVGDRA